MAPTFGMGHTIPSIWACTSLTLVRASHPFMSSPLADALAGHRLESSGPMVGGFHPRPPYWRLAYALKGVRPNQDQLFGDVVALEIAGSSHPLTIHTRVLIFNKKYSNRLMCNRTHHVAEPECNRCVPLPSRSKL